ncbi:MAG: hypothetical protein AAF333_18275 [Planctomycetota bacterium]
MDGRRGGWGLVVLWVGLAVAAPTGYGQVNYTFTAANDGFSWPASPTGTLNGFDFTTPDDIVIFNEAGNNLFYDAMYQVTGNATRINGDALWANPLDFGSGYVGFDFSGTATSVTQVQFDFAWSEAGVPAVSDFLDVVAFDSDGRQTFASFNLTDTFTGFGGGDGYEGTISLDAASLIDDEEGFDGGAFVDIDYIEVQLGEIIFGGNSSEFAIDNFSTNGAGGGDPANSDVIPVSSFNGNQFFGASTNRVKGSFDVQVSIDAENQGTGGTQYSVTVEPGSDPEFVATGLPSGKPIAAETVDMLLPLATLDADTLSGEYEIQLRFSNDLNGAGPPDFGSDPDEVVPFSAKIFDPPDMTDNSGATVQVDADPTLSLANAAAGPHAGALRAGVEATALSTSGPFSFDPTSGDLNLGAFVAAGETKTTDIAFDRFGRLSGTHVGTAKIDLEMKSPTESFLNGSAPVPSINWNLSYDLADITSDSVNLNATDPLNKTVGINTSAIAATLVDGVSTKTQSVSMSFVAPPVGDTMQVNTPGGDAVELTFDGGGVGTYVLQFTYDDSGLSPSEESALDLFWFDELSNDWAHATDGNSGGTASFFAGSYADFLLGAGSTDPAANLGAFGQDEVGNTFWAVLDHASIFTLGELLAIDTLTGDYNGDGFVSQADLNLVLLNWGQNVLPPGFDQTAIDGGGPFDGLISQNELNGVLLNWGNGNPPSVAVPEPGASALMLGLAGALVRRVRRDEAHR